MFWWESAPLEDRLVHIRGKQTYQLCSMWDNNYRAVGKDVKVREAISELLIERNENPMLCRNPESDKANRLEDRVEAAERRARNAEKKAKRAERAERRAKEAERLAKDLERRSKSGWD